MSEYQAKLPDFSKFIIGYPENVNNITREEMKDWHHRSWKFMNTPNRQLGVYLEPQTDRDKQIKQYQDYVINYYWVWKERDNHRLCITCFQLHKGGAGHFCLECAWEKFLPYWEHKKNRTYHSRESMFLMRCELVERGYHEEKTKEESDRKKREERKKQGLPEYDWKDDLRTGPLRIDAPKEGEGLGFKWVNLREVRD